MHFRAATLPTPPDGRTNRQAFKDSIDSHLLKEFEGQFVEKVIVDMTDWDPAVIKEVNDYIKSTHLSALEAGKFIILE